MDGIDSVRGRILTRRLGLNGITIDASHQNRVLLSRPALSRSARWKSNYASLLGEINNHDGE